MEAGAEINRRVVSSLLMSLVVQEDRDPFYDWALVHKVRRSLRSLREKEDARGVLGVLETCIRANFAGTESSRLYSEA